MNKFSFTCESCGWSYQDESFDLTCESECPECGQWNYKARPSLEKRSESTNNKKFSPKQSVAREIIIMGTSVISLGYSVHSVGKTVKIVSDHDQEISVNEYDPTSGRECIGYIPGCTSRIRTLKEFADIVKNGEAEFEGDEVELLDCLLLLELQKT